MKQGLLGVLLILSTSSSPAFTNEQQTEVYKTCLAAHGYNPAGFHSFKKFDKVATCISKYEAGKLEQEVIALKLWMKDNPQYGGPNWNWQTGESGYKCIKRDNGAVICRKPYYMN